MCRKCLFILLLINSAPYNDLLGQEKSGVSPQLIIDKFIEKTGGENWQNLKSRKEYGFVEYEEDNYSIVPSKSYDRIKVNMSPNMSIEVHSVSDLPRSILVFKPKCNWYYSNNSRIVKFFGPESVSYKTTFPRTEGLEILNLDVIKTVYLEDSLYRVDFKDNRQLNGKHSLFFGMNSGLLYRRTFTSKTGGHWDFHFSNYIESQGLSEPRVIELLSNGMDKSVAIGPLISVM